MWLLYAFAGPVLWAISVHLDKYLVDRYFKASSVAVMLVFTAFTGLAMLPFIGVYQPQALRLPAATIALMTLSGLLTMGALFFYLPALQSEEASVVAPYFQTSPLFGYALAYAVLGETLTPMQLAGGALIVLGALFLSIRTGGSRGAVNLRLVSLMVACALAIAVSSLIFKAVSLEDAFWPATFWMSVGQAAFGAGLLSVSRYRREFHRLIRIHTAPLLTVNGANELINLGGSLGARYALTLAPLSLVQAIGSTTTLFVFLFGTLISVISPRAGREDLSPRSLAQKAAATALIGGGVVLING